MPRDELGQGGSAWRRGEDDNVNAGIDEFLIGVEAEELLGLFDFEPFGNFLFAESG